MVYQLGERLERVRSGKGITQVELSKKAGISQAMISAYENGYRLPSVMALARIAEVLNCTTDELIRS